MIILMQIESTFKYNELIIYNVINLILHMPKKIISWKL